MYRKNRNEITQRCIDIVEKNEIRTQKDFANMYYEKYGEKLSQPTVHRMFDNANICVDSETGFYKYHGKPYESEPTEEDFLKQLLKLHSYGKYTHEKGISTIWLDVDFGSENLLAKRICDYYDNGVSIICGYGCLMIRCRTVDTYEKLRTLLKDYKK